jgi:peptide chain release factor 1
MEEKLERIVSRFEEVERQISDPAVMEERKRYVELTQEHSSLLETVETYRKYLRILCEIADAESLIEGESDPEMREMVRDELKGLQEKTAALKKRLQELLVPKDPMDDKNIIMEIRAGTGGDEAALFAADLYRMYSRFAENRKWKTEVLAANSIELGGYKEIIFSLSGNGVYGYLRYESGVHRVQRVPVTESGGRVHTSAVTVAVLPEPEETDIQVNQEDLRIDVFRSSGPGGQSVNTTDSAVRITHLPTGLVVSCQDEKSQHKNKAKALRVLRARLLEQEEEKKQQERAADRKTQIGSGDRSERIRTYNFPQNRLTDHRINLTIYRLDGVIQGDLEEVVEALRLSAREETILDSA